MDRVKDPNRPVEERLAAVAQILEHITAQIDERLAVLNDRVDAVYERIGVEDPSIAREQERSDAAESEASD